METNELLKRVRQIEIKTRGLSSNIFAGQYHSAFKGRGMAFSEVREYQYGDDIRDIDWNVTARFNKPFIKVFEEERELTVMLLIDVSGSLEFGTVKQMKKDMVTEIAATLAFSAIQNNDKIGVIFFSDKIEKFIPPKKGRKHILYIIRELIDFEPESRRTDVKQAVEYLTNVLKKRCTAFMLSDFIDQTDFRNAMTIANRKHDLVAIQVYDKRIEELPPIGLMKVKDAETGHEQWIDTSSAAVRKAQRDWWLKRKAVLQETFTKSNVDSVSIRTDQDYVKALLNLFAKEVDRNMSNILAKKKLVSMLIAYLFVAIQVVAQSVVVHADIDSIQIYIGEQAKIRLEASFDAKQKAVFPLFSDTIVNGLELVEVAKPDTQYLNERQRLHIIQEYTVTAFEENLYKIPSFKVFVDNKLYESEELALKVYTFPVDTLHQDQFFGQKSVMEPPFAWEDWALVIWLSLIAIPLMALLIFFIIRFNDNKPIIRKVKVEPKLPPHEQAMKEILRIKEEKIWQKGRAKEYYTELTDAIRTYIRDRFGFNALEMTSSEIIEKLLESNDKESIEELKNLFITADLVKFAKHDPFMNENDMNLVSAIDFINSTKQEILPDSKTELSEITIEEKRSKRTKFLLAGGIFVLVIGVAGILVYVGMQVYELCF